MPSGYVYTWTGKVSSNFGDAGNWFNSTTGTTASAAPGTSDEALISASGAINGPGAVYELGITGIGGGLTLGGSLNGSYAFLGGTVTLASNASLGSGNLVDIGDYSSESIAQHIPTLVTVNAGATLFSANGTAGALDILIGQSGDGTLAVNGAHALATAGSAGIWAGNGGLGVINVTNGGQVYGGGQTGQFAGDLGLVLGSNGGTGLVNVSGSGSAGVSGLAFGNIVDVGYGGTGSLALSAQGNLIAGDNQTSLIIGDFSSASFGTVSLTSATATLYGTVFDGSYGNGLFSLSGGATAVLNSNASFGTGGTWSALVGAESGSHGTLSLAGGSQISASHGIVIGSYGYGSLSVTGASITISQVAGSGDTALSIGLGSSSQGVAQILGGTVDDAQNAGIIVGGYGSGTLSIGAYGSTSSTVTTGGGGGAGFVIGSAAGSSGTVSLSGNSVLQSGDTVIVGGAGSGTMSITSGGTLVVNGSQTATGLVVGNSGGTGALAVSGANATIFGQIIVGSGSSGSLSLSNGSTFSGTATNAPALVVGAQAGVSGSVTLSQTVMNLSGGLTIGSGGTGSFAIGASAQVSITLAAGESAPGLILGAGSGSFGTLSVEGGTLSTSTGIAVGSLGDGLLQVSGGAITIDTAAGQGLYAMSAGNAAGTTGSISIAGGVVNDIGQAGVILGSVGNGSLSISSGGTLLTGDPSGNAGFSLGLGNGSSGVASVSGAGARLGVNGTALDGASGTGAITISGGASFAAGASATATGLALGGSGGIGRFTLSAASASILGQTQVGAYGSGTLAISGGGTFSGQSSGFEALAVAAGTSTTGSLLITDAGTNVTLTGGLAVGLNGNAEATIQNGATVSTSAWSGNGGQSVVIEAAQGAGTLTVTGAATRLTATGEFQVGGTLGSGAGTLLIASGATVTTALASGQSIDGATIGGTGANAQSVASIAGTGSAWSVAGILGVGEGGGSALLTIGAGGTVTAGSVAVDTNGTATRGTVSVSGAGARLTAGTLTLGNASATGSLAVSAGGSVGIVGTSSIHGSVSLSAGTLTTGALSIAAGSSITGNGVLSAGSTVDLGTIGVTSGQLYCLGSITGSGSLTVGAKALLVLNRNVASSVSVVFGAGGGEVSVPSSSILQGTIFDWASGDAIAIKNQNVLTDSFSKGTLTLYGANNAVLGSLHFNGNLALHNFTLSHQSGAQTVILYHG